MLKCMLLTMEHYQFSYAYQSASISRRGYLHFSSETANQKSVKLYIRTYWGVYVILSAFRNSKYRK